MLGLSTTAINTGQPVNWGSGLNYGLISWWLTMHNPYSGGTRFLDLCSRNHGTLTATPTWGGPLGAPGQFGRLTFNGSSNYVATTLASADTDFSCEVIFNGSGAENNGRIVDKDFSNGFTINRNGTSSTDFTAYIKGTNVPAITLGNSAWHQLVLTRSGTTGTLYANGGASSTSASVGGVAFNTASLYIGAITGGVSHFWSGSVIGVKYWNRALSASEVLASHNEWRQGYPLTLNRVRPYSVLNSAAVGGSNLLAKMQNYGLYASSRAA